MADKNPPERVTTGREYLDVSQGAARTEEILGYLAEFHPDLPDFLIEHGFDALYTRPSLTLQQRQLINVTTLVTQGDTGNNLYNHFVASLNLGLTEEELREALLHLTLYVGMPRALNAMAVLKEVVDERG